MAWITAEEALRELGTARQTLYANVSRGRIRARPQPGDPRRSLYNAEDVRRLAERGAGRRKAEALAAETIRWGEPILESAISTVIDGQLVYRGRDAVSLAQTATLEEVAAILWEADNVTLRRSGPALTIPPGLSPLEAGLSILSHRAANDPPSASRGPAALKTEAGSVVGDLAAALAGAGEAPLHKQLAEGWHRPEAADLLRRALVLLADHELNASSFACRVAVSTGAPLAAGLLAGLATLSGPLHGAASAAAFALADAAEKAGPERAVRDWLARGHPLPAFGHVLYPQGDPRAMALVAACPLPPAYAGLAEVAGSLVGEPPNVDFALAALTDGLDLPRSAPLTLFALARSVGWAAHALEQAGTGTLIRPRARYTGRRPT